MSDYRNLEVWKKSRALAAEVYRLTERFPRSEIFGLTSQMRRAALSIALNIAEGNGRWTKRDQSAFIVTARASAQELEAICFVAEDLKFITAEMAERLRKSVNQIGRMLNGLLQYYANRDFAIQEPATRNWEPKNPHERRSPSAMRTTSASNSAPNSLLISKIQP